MAKPDNFGHGFDLQPWPDSQLMGHGAEQIAHGFPISQTINVYVFVLKSHEQNHQNHPTSNLA